MQNAVVNDRRVLSWTELMKPRDKDASAAFQAVPDTLAIMNSSATTLSRIGDALACILVLFKSQALSPAVAKSLSGQELAQDEEVCYMHLLAANMMAELTTPLNQSAVADGRATLAAIAAACHTCC